MIDLTKIVERIQTRIAEMGTNAAALSAEATDSKDTIRNWIRSVDADKKNGTQKASATTIKLNQVEAALGIELTRTVSDDSASPESQLRAALLAYGVHEDDMRGAFKAIAGFIYDDEDDDEPLEPDIRRHRSAPGTRRRVSEPSE